MTTTIVYTPLHEMELDVARFSAFIVLTWMPWWRMCKRHPDVCRGSVLPKGATCTERWKMFLVFTSQLFLFRSYILSFAWRLARHADRSYDVCFGGDVCQCHDVVILQGKQNFSYNYHNILKHAKEKNHQCALSKTLIVSADTSLNTGSTRSAYSTLIIRSNKHL